MKSVIFPHRMTDASDYQTSLSFFERLLREGSPCRLVDEYPLVFRPEFHDRLFIKKLNGELVAGLAALPRVIEIDKDRKLKALFVGSVVTDPTKRLQGFQRELFHAAEEFAESSHQDIIVLWSSQIAFYEKLGFFLGGLQATWSPNTRLPLSILKSQVLVSDSAAAELTQQHYKAFTDKKCRVERSFEEMSLLWKIPKMKVATTPNAYALLGKGEDFAKVCHEWAGPADEVLACFEALRRIEPGMRILSPGVLHTDDERKVVMALESQNFEVRLEYLGLIKLVNQSLDKKDFDPSQLKFPFFVWGLDSI